MILPPLVSITVVKTAPRITHRADFNEPKLFRADHVLWFAIRQSSNFFGKRLCPPSTTYFHCQAERLANQPSQGKRHRCHLAVQCQHWLLCFCGGTRSHSLLAPRFPSLTTHVPYTWKNLVFVPGDLSGDSSLLNPWLVTNHPEPCPQFTNTP
jgi:hypothetical protein